MEKSATTSGSATRHAALARQAGAAVLGLDDGRMRCAALAWRADLAVAPAECLQGVEEFRVSGPLGSETGRVVAIDPSTDVALVRCARVWSSEVQQTLETPAVGDAVALVAREGADLTIDWRSIRRAGGPWRSRHGARIDQRIEIAAGPVGALQGSAIVTEDGRVSGMAVHGPRRLTLGIPSVTIERVVAEFLAHGRLRRGYLGINVLPLPLAPEVASRWQVEARGVLVVAGLAADSPAGAAGIDVGDLLLSADGEALTRPEVLTAHIRDRAPGQTVKLGRRRGLVIEEIEVSLGERPLH